MTKNLVFKSLRTFLFVLVIILSIVVILWSLIALYSSVGTTIGMIAPILVALLLIIWALYHLIKKKPLIRHKGWRIAITLFVCIGFLIMGILEAIILSAAYAPLPEEDVDYVIVLGCGIFPSGNLTLSLKNRLDTAYDYLIAHEDTVCIVSGGQGETEPFPEADGMKNYLLSRGIAEKRIIAEDRSTSTEENLIYSLNIMKAHKGSEKPVGIVTNDFHIYRSLKRAKQYGIDAFGIEAPTPWRVWLSNNVRECLAVLDMYVFG